MATFEVSLVTPDGAAFEGEVEMVIVPGEAGAIGVLARRAPLVAMLKAGSTRIYRDRQSEDVVEFATGPGFLKVEEERRRPARGGPRGRPRHPPPRPPPAPPRGGGGAAGDGAAPSSPASSRATRTPTAGSSSSASATRRTSWRSRAAPREALLGSVDPESFEGSLATGLPNA